MNQPQKFLFETSFEGPGDAAGTAAAKRPAATHTDEDLERARAEGFAAGSEAGKREALQSLEHASSQALDRIAAQLSDLAETWARAGEQQHDLALQLAQTIQRKLFPHMTKKHGPAEIEAMITECLHHLREEPRVVVRVTDRLLDAMKDKVSGLAERLGFEGRLVFLADDSLGPSDVRVEWADGGAERHGDWLWQQIDAAVERALSGESSAGRAATTDAAAHRASA